MATRPPEGMPRSGGVPKTRKRKRTVGRPPEGMPRIGLPGGSKGKGGGKGSGKGSGQSQQGSTSWTPTPTTPAPTNISTILGNDPLWAAAQAMANAESIADAAGRDTAIRRALINFGQLINLPEGFFRSPELPLPPGYAKPTYNTTWEQILDPATREAIRKSTESGMSTMARLTEAAGIAKRNTTNNMVSRGNLRTGETGYQLKARDMEATRSQFDATNQLLDYLYGVQNAFLVNERNRIAALWGAYEPPDSGGSGGSRFGPGGAFNPGIPSGTLRPSLANIFKPKFKQTWNARRYPGGRPQQAM